MRAVKLVKIAIVGRVMLRPIPPVPIAAFGNQNLFKGQLALRLAGPRGVLRVKLAGIVQIIPGSIVLRRANPHIEIRIDP